MARKTFTFEGKRYDIVAKSDEELAVKIAMRKRDLKEGKETISNSMTVRSWFKTFMKSYKEGSLSPETYDDYFSRWNSKIDPYIGSMKIKDVRQIHCQNVINQMDGSSKTYIKKVANTMFQMFERAKSNKLILENPAADIEFPEAEDGTHRALTDFERDITIKVAEYHRGGLWVLTLLYCGLRPSEAARLDGRHLDFMNKRVIVEGAVKKKGNRLGKTKTESGNRILPMPSNLEQKFRDLKRKPLEPVFQNNNGGRLSKTNMRILWNNFKREMNIAAGCEVYRNQVLPPYRIADDLVPYCYRHTFCTDLEAAGVSINEASRLMGHKDIRVTSKIYTHYSQESFDRVALLMDNYQNTRNNPGNSNENVGVDVGVDSTRTEK
ncbi:MAG: site-specific integrase [Parabacteroides sp.]|nr:site-specific integrase [Parabacteroides sp.]